MLYYFGTSLKSSGHYFWKCDGARLLREPYLTNSRLPFDPERLIPDHPLYSRQTFPPRRNGDVDFFFIAPYSILYITGSCIDTRGGCKTVFFTKQDLKKKEMVVEVLKSDAAWNLIDAMDFREFVILNLQK